MGRRSLLGLAVAGLCATAGCAALPPRVPTPTPSPTPLPPAELAALALVRAVDAVATASAADDPWLPTWTWSLEVAREHLDAIHVPVPALAPRTPAPSATASPTPNPALAPARQALTAALAAALGPYRATALDPATAQPLVWASMAAWAATLASRLGQATPGPVQADQRRHTPPVQSAQEAAADALSAAQQVLYAVQVAAGTPGLPPEELSRLRGLIRFWSQVRDDVASGVRTRPSASVRAPEPWFAVSLPADPAAAAALVAQVHAASLAIIGRSVAFGAQDLRNALVGVLERASVEAATAGAELPRWPGWPQV